MAQREQSDVTRTELFYGRRFEALCNLTLAEVRSYCPKEDYQTFLGALDRHLTAAFGAAWKSPADSARPRINGLRSA